jgi:tetratricopeptide (TPR) repeat protein
MLRELEKMNKSKSVAQQIFADILQIDSGFVPQNPEITYSNLKALVKNDPDNIFAASRLAELVRMQPHIHRDEPLDIQGVFKDLRVKQPNDPFSYARLAMCSKKLGLWTDTKELLEEALKKDSEDFFSLKQLAILHRKRTKNSEPDLKAAKIYITHALKLRSQDLSCIENKAEIERLSGHIDKAKKLFEQVLSQQRRLFSLSRLGEIYRIGGQGVQKSFLIAHNYFCEAEKLKPTNCFVQNRLAAIALAAIGLAGSDGVKADAKYAETVFLKVLKMRPHDPFALGRLGELRRQEGNFKKAKQLLHSSYEGFSDDPYVLTSYAIVLRQMPKKSAEDRIFATALMEKARRLAPSDPLINERDRAVSQVGIEEVQTDQKRKMDLLIVALHRADQYRQYACTWKRDYGYSTKRGEKTF